MKRVLLSAAVAAALAGCSGERKGNVLSPALGPDPYEFLAGKLSSAHDKMNNNGKVAVLPFSYTDKRETSDGVIISERIITRIADKGNFELVERGLLEKVMGELNLQHSGVMDDSSIKDIGKILGVEAVITGTLTAIKNGEIEVNARLIRTRSAEILSAAKTKVYPDWMQGRPAPREAARTIPPAEITPANAVRQQARYSADSRDTAQGQEFSLQGAEQIRYLDTNNYADFEASTDIMFTKNYSAAGLIFRARGPASFYYLEWYTPGDNVCAEELGIISGKDYGWERLVKPLKRTVQLNRWYEFKVRAVKDSVKCYLDGALVYDVKDSKYREGRIGVRVWLDNEVFFRNLRVKPL